MPTTERSAYSDLVQAMEDWFHGQPKKATNAVVPCAIPGGAAAVNSGVSVLVRGDCLLPPARLYSSSLERWATVANDGAAVDATEFRAWLGRYGEDTVQIYGEPFNASLVSHALDILPCPVMVRCCVQPVPASGSRPFNALFVDGPDWRVIVAPVGFPEGRPRGFPSWPVSAP